MIGSLSATPPAAADQGGAAAAERGRGRPIAARVAAPVEQTGERLPVDASHREAQRLKALLTDPGMRVSTHRDDASGHVVLRVENRATGEIVDQIPSEELLRLYAALREPLVDERA